MCFGILKTIEVISKIWDLGIWDLKSELSDEMFIFSLPENHRAAPMLTRKDKLNDVLLFDDKFWGIFDDIFLDRCWLIRLLIIIFYSKVILYQNLYCF